MMHTNHSIERLLRQVLECVRPCGAFPFARPTHNSGIRPLAPRAAIILLPGQERSSISAWPDLLLR